jgi:hypothetical protein
LLVTSSLRLRLPPPRASSPMRSARRRRGRATPR